jgi:DNA-binding MarR family transcriptional regulator
MGARARNGGQPASKQRLRLWVRLLRTARAIESELRERLRVEFATTLPQFDVMAALARKNTGMTMTELSRFLMVSNGNVTGIIDRLVADKLVLRRAPAEDRRAIIVRLTPKGASQFAQIAKVHEGWVDKLLSDLDSAESEAVISMGSLCAFAMKDFAHEYDQFQAGAFQLARRQRRRGRYPAVCVRAIRSRCYTAKYARRASMKEPVMFRRSLSHAPSSRQ